MSQSSCLGAGGALEVSCDVYSLLQKNPLAPLAVDGTTVAQLVYGKGMPAGGLYCPGTSPAGPCPVSTQPYTNCCALPLSALGICLLETIVSQSISSCSEVQY